MVATQIRSETASGVRSPNARREQLEHRRRVLREAIGLFRQRAVGRERLRLLRRTEDELVRVEADLARLDRPISRG